MYYDNIKKTTEENTNYREVMYTGKYSQLVVMSLNIGEEIGEEVHEFTDQTIVIVEGEAEATINNERLGLEEDDIIVIPAGAKHNIKNIGDKKLKLYTIYAPPEHHRGMIQPTK